MTGRSGDTFGVRLGRLRADLIEQGRRVQAMAESAFEAVLARDREAAAEVVSRDDVIDRVDVEIERAAVRLLAEWASSGGRVGEREVRALLTVVKVNNELERIADLAVTLGERVPDLVALGRGLPETFRVISNSVIGILRDVARAVDEEDAGLCRVVLNSEAAVEAFRREVMKEAGERLERGEWPVGLAFVLQEMCDLCERMADHATNIAEQVIYSVTGQIVRHTEGRWEDVPLERSGEEG